MTTKLPRDANGDKIQTLGVKDNGSHQISVSATSARNATRFDEKTFVVWLYATADLFFSKSLTTTPPPPLRIISFRRAFARPCL